MEIVSYLQNNGIRPSYHRTEVMRFLNDNRIHPSVDTIYDALSTKIPTLSRTTIYNILNLFVEKGVAQSITIDPRQCRYDADMSEHTHFLCTECGDLYDIPNQSYTLDTEHRIDMVHMYAKGVCKKCINK